MEKIEGLLTWILIIGSLAYLSIANYNKSTCNSVEIKSTCTSNLSAEIIPSVIAPGVADIDSMIKSTIDSIEVELDSNITEEITEQTAE